MKKLLSFFLIFALLAAVTSFADTPAALSFSASNDIKELQSLDGQRVTIVGYMATMSPISGAFMYLMNLPYQSCPFCVPNTAQLANTMAVYAPSGKKFDFTDQAIRVTGTLRVEDYSDEFGYEYNYRIVDASYTVVDLSSIRSDYALWTALASEGITSEIYGMFDYLYFICQWQDYMFNFVDETGQMQTVPIWPGDVMGLLEDDEYGYRTQTDDDYFQNLIRRVRAISPDALEDLVAILQQCEEVRAYALGELYGENFKYDPETDGYTQDAYDELYLAWQDVWYAFAGDFINRWQM